MKILLIAGMIGLALGLFVYSLWKLFDQLGRADQTYRDRPPLGFRLLWPLVNLFGNSVAFALSDKRRADLAAALRRGGQEYALTARQFFGGKLAAAIVGGGFGLLMGGEEHGVNAALVLAALGYVYPNIWLKEHTTERNLAILKALPFFIDIVTLSVESGLNLTGALQKAVDRCKPGPLVVEMDRVLRDVRAGKPRVDAMRDLGDRLSYAPMSSLTNALVQAELMGSSLGPILRAQSDQRRIERFQRAEKLAMEAPVKMLGPLIMFIFPCTFVIIGFPIVVKILGSGL